MTHADNLYGEALRQFVVAIKVSATTLEEIRRKLPFYAFIRRYQYKVGVQYLEELYKIGLAMWLHVDGHVRNGECPGDAAN